MDAKDVAKTSWCEITQVGLHITGKPTWDEYQEEFEKWEIVQRLSTFALGDLLSYGNLRWGETYAQVAASTRFTVEYLRNVKYVCSKVPLNIRNNRLSFAHHQAVASLKQPVMQQEWLEYAATQELTRDELRKQASDDDHPPDTTLTSGDNGVEQMIVFPDPLLEEVVADYILAIHIGDSKKAQDMFMAMENMVKDWLHGT